MVLEKMSDGAHVGFQTMFLLDGFSPRWLDTPTLPLLTLQMHRSSNSRNIPNHTGCVAGAG